MPYASEDEYREVYAAHFGDDDGFELHQEIWRETGLEMGDDDTDLYTYERFLDAYGPDVDGQAHDKAYWDELRNDFMEEFGFTDESMDWEAWREWIGYPD